MKSLAIDIHAHALIEEVERLVRGQAGGRREVEVAARVTFAQFAESSLAHLEGLRAMPSGNCTPSIGRTCAHRSNVSH
jgi:hypothetical protein